MTFSALDRTADIHRLGSEVFDILVVGGGITGAGIARDAALRGLKVGLIERGDFAIGTSSRSSKLIHGGLRYLEMGDVKLVFEAVRERQRLMRLAPHLARPQSFVLPVYRGAKHGVFALDVGLTIYDVMAAFAGVLTHKAVRTRALRRLEPLLREQNLQGGVRYYDAMTDDGRLVMANLRGAVQAGAVVASRVSLQEPVIKNGHLVAVRARDEWHGQGVMVACKVLVVAVGPWTDEVMEKLRGHQSQNLKPSKGVHIVVPRERLPLSQAVMMTARDGRVVFGLPWSHATVIGTTDTAHTGDLAEPACTWEDATYLCQTANDHFNVVGEPLGNADIISTWAGIRPLVANDPSQSSYKTSREHAIVSDPLGIVAISGGKLTTYRVMAQQTVDAALPLLPRDLAIRPCETTRLPLPGAEHLPGVRRPLAALQAVLEQGGVAAEDAHYFASQFGTEAEQVLRWCAQTPDGMTRVLPDLPVRWGELRWLADQEMAMTLTDLLVRRTQLYYLAGERLQPLLPLLAQRLAAWLQYDSEREAAIIEEMQAFMVARRVQPQSASVIAVPAQADHAA